MKIIVLGANGKVGHILVRHLEKNSLNVVAVGRSADKLANFQTFRIADLNDAVALTAALHDATHIINVAHARFTAQILAAAPPAIERIIIAGSTRRFTRFPDKAADEVRHAEQLVLQSKCGVILHPTMIYGAAAENNVKRIASYIRRFSIVPLPGQGRALVQPIHIDDVVLCLEAALQAPAILGQAIVIAGPSPVAYMDFVTAIADAIGKKVRIFSLPLPLLLMAASLTKFLPFLPTIKAAEIKRLLENKNFDISVMQQKLNVTPKSLQEGLRLTFNQGQIPR